jgi:hypothetical protein
MGHRGTLARGAQVIILPEGTARGANEKLEAIYRGRFSFIERSNVSDRTALRLAKQEWPQSQNVKLLFAKKICLRKPTRL